MKLKILLRLIGAIQIALGLLYLLWPQGLLQNMGHTLPAADIYYPLGMLAARFLVYGAGLWVAAAQPENHRFWINNMIFIQLIDLSTGAFYTLNGTVGLSLSGFPMFNAAWIAGLLWLWHPRAAPAIQAA